MAQGSRPKRVADVIRAELSELLTRRVKDPGVGFLTITRVEVTPDLQQARVFYTTLGDAAQRKASDRALARAAPFLRLQMGHHLSLKRTPAITFQFDKSIAHQDRIERLLDELRIAPADGDPAALDPLDPDDE